ncbi:hypothetical protein E2562_034982 [Oryza meyeriana var. granulata]|uniref:Uncharacterized protein n=1 Tax=Oryza meyeriana var. granulata TaxID=110450 RepID=A0A6G1C9E5_9ORYZ|nr:hypothetical protein E2562_034982 [Oryza meyeriana var. granulata]
MTDTYLTHMDSAWHKVECLLSGAQLTAQEVLGALRRIINRIAQAIQMTSCRHPQQVIKPVAVPQFRPTGMAGLQYFLFGQHTLQFEEDFAHTDVGESAR